MKMKQKSTRSAVSVSDMTLDVALAVRAVPTVRATELRFLATLVGLVTSQVSAVLVLARTSSALEAVLLHVQVVAAQAKTEDGVWNTHRYTINLLLFLIDVSHSQLNVSTNIAAYLCSYLKSKKNVIDNAHSSVEVIFKVVCKTHIFEH
jgi:hypothetical protein